MREIKISHEVPLSLLQYSKQFNDYDYCLAHLVDEYEQYKNFYSNSKREVILDNSIFELGQALTDEKLIKFINEVNPTYYIIPDVLEDCDGTINRAKTFLKKSKSAIPSTCKSIGVVQGNTYEDLIRCHQYMNEEANVDKIALSFDYSLYENIYDDYFGSFVHVNKFYKWMVGRSLIIDNMINDGIINYNKPYHLLGCALPQEGLFYKTYGYRFIDSIDTSSPIVHGLLGISYNKNGLDEKKTIKLVNLINSIPTEEEMNIIKHNIDLFRKFWN